MTNTQTSPLEAAVESQASSAPSAPASLEHGELFVGGRWVAAASGARRDVVDPSTGNAIGTVAEGDAGDIDAAVAAARAAFDHGPWRTMSGRDRARVLHRFADLIR